MDDHVVAPGPVGLVIHVEARFRAAVVGMNLRDFDVGAGFEPFFQDIFLRRIIVAATAGDEQDAERLGVGGAGGERGEQNGECDREGG